jgi:hypothetical protein
VTAEAVFRREYGRCVATLIRFLGDIDAAEEAVQDAFTEASARWPSDGLPPNPGAWIVTTARNRVIDRLRRESVRDERHAQAHRLDGADAAGEARSTCSACARHSATMTAARDSGGRSLQCGGQAGSADRDDGHIVGMIQDGDSVATLMRMAEEHWRGGMPGRGQRRRRP